MTGLDLYNSRNPSGGGFWQPGLWTAPDGSPNLDGASWWLNPFNPSTPIQDIYFVDNGYLQLTIQPTPDMFLEAVQGLPFVAPFLNTFPTFSQQYGYFEIQCSIPKVKGTRASFGLIPAVAAASPPEIRIFNILSPQGEDNIVNLSLHKVDGTFTDFFVNNWNQNSLHTYGLNWQADSISFYVDGEKLAEYQTPEGFDVAMFMFLSFGVGDTTSWQGGIDRSSRFPATWFISYIRVWPSYPY